MPVIHFAIARCQHRNGGCQAAANFSRRAAICSPYFPSTELLNLWLSTIAKDTQRRRCPSCKRPIAMRHFERRTWCQDETDQSADQVAA